MSTLKVDPLSQRNSSFATSREVWKYITDSGITTVSWCWWSDVDDCDDDASEIADVHHCGYGRWVVDLCFVYHSSTSCREVEYFDDRVHLSVSIYVEVHVQSSPNFWSMLLLTVAQSSSGGVIIHYVLPVLWMTSYLHNVQKQATWKDYYYATSVQRPLSRTTWLSRYQKGKTSLHLNKARDDGVLGCSGISWTVCKQCAPNSRQIITPTPHHSLYTQDKPPGRDRVWLIRLSCCSCY